MRPGVPSWMAAAKLAVVASSRWVSSGSTNRVIRRATTPRAADVSSAVATDVTRSTNSCASSTTSSACSGSTADSATASMASSAWLVTTTSASAGPATCPFGEALGAKRTARHAQAFPRRHADLRPGSVRYTGLQIVAVAGIGRRRPGGEPLHVAAQRGDRHRVEKFFLRPLVV